MTVNDRGTCIIFYADCIRIAELQFTRDFGNVLIVNPNCLQIKSRRRLDGLEIVRPEYQRDFDRIVRNWHVDRYTVDKSL